MWFVEIPSRICGSPQIPAEGNHHLLCVYGIHLRLSNEHMSDAGALPNKRTCWHLVAEAEPQRHPPPPSLRLHTWCRFPLQPPSPTASGGPWDPHQTKAQKQHKLQAQAHGP